MMNELDKALLTGFTQGRNIGYYCNNLKDIPQEPGVYAIVKHPDSPTIFLENGTGGFFKGENPNVPLAELQSNWVEDSSILYIGKASNLRNRLSQYFRFGQGKNIGHKGGRYIWQLSCANDFIVYWKPTPNTDPDAVETELIQFFKQSHNGMRPFANLTK